MQVGIGSPLHCFLFVVMRALQMTSPPSHRQLLDWIWIVALREPLPMSSVSCSALELVLEILSSLRCCSLGEPSLTRSGQAGIR
jgi:hypothetical protein